jgi:hypothetical protein
LWGKDGGLMTKPKRNAKGKFESALPPPPPPPDPFVAWRELKGHEREWRDQDALLASWEGKRSYIAARREQLRAMWQADPLPLVAPPPPPRNTTGLPDNPDPPGWEVPTHMADANYSSTDWPRR